jgi:A/G-specific adenine glycosylase
MKRTRANENASLLVEWFRANKRDLPWRMNRDPYRIWISETMLQQTTTTAVIPYFERFIRKFPTLAALAKAPESHVVEAWAGLGYYSRARNLHKAARKLHALPAFPQSYQQLLELPGLGPYTARAVASIAFGEKVGVVDGNVIRVLSRLRNEKWDWWKPKAREQIQALADEWAVTVSSHEVNQGLMELGRAICTPISPSCLLCPLRPGCLAHKAGHAESLPGSKPRRKKEIWWWRPELHWRSGQVGFVRNTRLPFLKGQWLLPGEGQTVTKPPKKFDCRHSITHYDIFVTVVAAGPKLKAAECRWIKLEEIPRHVPTSLVVKALRAGGPWVDGRPADGPSGLLNHKRRPRRSPRRRLKPR